MSLHLMDQKYGPLMTNFFVRYAHRSMKRFLSKRGLGSIEPYEFFQDNQIIAPNEKQGNLIAMVMPLGLPIFEGDLNDDYLSETDWNSIGFYVIDMQKDTSEFAELSSFHRWEKEQKVNKLAFIFMGEFYFYEKKETLNDVAKRYFMDHPEAFMLFNEKYSRTLFQFKADRTYIQEILENGGMIFHKREAYLIGEYYGDLATFMWAIAATNGYFPIKDLFFIHKTEILEYLGI